VQRTTWSLPIGGRVGRFPDVKRTAGYMAVLFISIGRMPFMTPTLDNADPLFVFVMTPGFYLHTRYKRQSKTNLVAVYKQIIV